MRRRVGLRGLALLVVVGGVVGGWWLAREPFARDTPAGSASADRAARGAARAPTEGAALRGARRRSELPLGVRIRVRTRAGEGPPPGLVGVLETPPALREERRGILQRAFRRADFEGDTLTLGGLHYRLWDLRIVAPGHFGVSREALWPAGVGGEPPRLDVVLPAPAALTVRVLTAAGSALPGAVVRVRAPDVQGLVRDTPVHPDDQTAFAAWRGRRTDASGRAELPMLFPATELALEVAHPAHPARTVVVTTPASGGHDELLVRLDAPSGIRGAVDLRAFAAPPEAVLLTHYHHEARTARLVARVPVAPDGSFLLPNVPPGANTVQLTARGVHGAQTALRHATVPRGAVVDLGLVGPDAGTAVTLTVQVEAPVPPDARVRVVVFAAGAPPEPVPAAAAEAPPAPDALDALEFVLPVGRRYALQGLPAGDLGFQFLLVDPSGADVGADHRAPTLALAAGQRGEPLEVVFSRAAPEPAGVRTAVRVRPPEDVAPRALRWRMLVLAEDGRQLGGLAWQLPVGTAAATALLPACDEPVRFYALAHGRVAGPVRRSRWTASGSIAFTDWRPAARLSVRVEDADGEPVAGVPVTVGLARDGAAAAGGDEAGRDEAGRDEAGGPHRRLVAYEERTGEDGHAALTVVPGMPLVVTVTHPRLAAPWHATVSAAELAAGAEATRRVRLPVGR